MTTGDRLLAIRKQHNLSQEELGKRLMVSRQTISLWETDQTMPTVDNLLKLKEIYGVSVDEILCEIQPYEHEVKDKAITEPLERYEFTYTISELKKLFSYLNRSFYIRYIAGIVLFGVLAAVQAGFGDYLLAGIFFGFFFVFVILLTNSHSRIKRTNTIAYNRISLSDYTFEFFEEYFSVSIKRGGELIRFQRIRYDEVEKYRQAKDYLIIIYSNQSYVLRLCDIAENSIVLKHIGKTKK